MKNRPMADVVFIHHLSFHLILATSNGTSSLSYPKTVKPLLILVLLILVLLITVLLIPPMQQ